MGSTGMITLNASMSMSTVTKMKANAAWRRGWSGEFMRATLLSMFAGRLGPDDVVLLIERHDHEAGILTATAEPMHGFGRHDGDASGGERHAGHALHTGQDPAADDNELFFGRVIMSRHPASGRRLQQEGRWARVRVPVLERALQAFNVAVLRKGRVLERRDEMPGGLRLRRGVGGVSHSGGGQQREHAEQHLTRQARLGRAEYSCSIRIALRHDASPR